jgi:tripartite-type tricarboxylate transporter receptor subunit TctC
MRSRATCAVTPGGTWRTISSSTMRFEDGMINPMRAVMPLASTFAKSVPASNSSLAWRRSHREHAMTLRSHCLHALAWLCALVPFVPAAARAEDAYPSRPIHIVIPFPAGGPSDIAARIIAQRMSEDWGQPVIVDNRPGANTIIGAEIVAKAAPDGYTLLMAIDSTLVMNQYLYKTLPYDPLNDFAPITTTVKSMSLLCVPAQTGPTSVQELIARGKAEPGKLNYGAGTITVQLAGLLFNKAAGIDVVYVPFKGTAETVQGLLTGSVDMVYAATVVAGPLIESGKVRALAKLDGRKEPYPDMPTLAAAAGLQNFDDISIWLGLVAPKATPRPIIDKLNREVVHILSQPDVREKFNQTGNFAVTSTAAEFAAFIRSEAARWEKVLKEAGISYD